MTPYRLVIINKSIRHHVALVYKVTAVLHCGSPVNVAIFTPSDGKSRITDLLCSLLSSVNGVNRPANRLTVLSVIKRQRFRTIGCQGEKNLICISHLFRCVPPSIVSSKLKYLYTLISFVQANTYDIYLCHAII